MERRVCEGIWGHLPYADRVSETGVLMTPAVEFDNLEDLNPTGYRVMEHPLLTSDDSHSVGRLLFERQRDLNLWEESDTIMIARDGVHNVREQTWGATGDGVTDDHAVLQQCIDDSKSLSGGRRVYFPAGVYYISEPLKIAATADVDVRVHFEGGCARRGTRIVQTDNTKNIFEFTNTTQNIRGVTMENLAMYGGNHGVFLQRSSYFYMRNCAFMQTDGHAVYTQDGSHNTVFEGCWFVHLDGNAMSILGAGDCQLIGCHIGEDAGAFDISGNLLMTGCRLYGSADKLNGTDGWQSMGKATFNVSGSGSLTLTGNFMGFDHSMINYDNGDRIIVAGNYLQFDGNDGALINVRRRDVSHPLVFKNNVIVLAGTTMSLANSTLGRDLKSLYIHDNAITYATGSSVTVDSDLLDPQFRNNVSGNSYDEVSSL